MKSHKINFLVLTLILTTLSMQIMAKKELKQLKQIASINNLKLPKIYNTIESKVANCSPADGLRLVVKKVNNKHVIGLDCGEKQEELNSIIKGEWTHFDTSNICLYKCNIYVNTAKGWRTTCKYKREITSKEEVNTEYTDWLIYTESLGGLKYSNTQLNQALNANCPHPRKFGLKD